MADEPTTPQVTPPAGEPVTPPPPSTPALAATTHTPEPPAGDGSDTISLEEARKLRSEAANLRKRMKAYEEAEQAARDAQLTELERTKKQHAEAQAELETYRRATQERLVRYEVERQAGKLGIIDPDAAARLIDWSELDYDEEGTPTNAEKLLEKLLKNKPYLKTPEPASTSAPTPTQSAPQTPQAPMLPAMNRGRTGFTAPQPGTQPGKPPSLSDVFRRS